MTSKKIWVKNRNYFFEILIVKLNKYSLIWAWIGLVMSANANANKLEITSDIIHSKISDITSQETLLSYNPLSWMQESFIIDSSNWYIEESWELRKFMEKRINLNDDIEEIKHLLNEIYFNLQLWRNISAEENKLMELHSKNFHNEEVNFLIWKFLLETSWRSENIKQYFLQTLKCWNKYKKAIEEIYFSKIFKFIKEDSSLINDPFINSIILDFIPYMTIELIVNSWIDKKIIDNILLIKEYKHNLDILKSSNNINVSMEFIELHVMALYRKNENNIDINFLMGEYMLNYWLFPEKMRECFLKALKWWDKYFDSIHKIFLTKIINLIREDSSILYNKDYNDTITKFLPYIEEDLVRLGFNVPYREDEEAITSIKKAHFNY